MLEKAGFLRHKRDGSLSSTGVATTEKKQARLSVMTEFYLDGFGWQIDDRQVDGSIYSRDSYAFLDRSTKERASSGITGRAGRQTRMKMSLCAQSKL